MVTPSAYFDSLSICLRLQKRLNEPSTIEICLFSYLSCLLWLYNGRPVSTWDYSFTVTRQAFVFSPDIQSSIETLRDMGYLQVKDDFYLQITQQGELEHERLKTLVSMAEREPYLEGACSSLLSLPYGLIRNALQHEPDIKTTIALSQSRQLLTGHDLDLLYEQFNVLSSAIGIKIKDLMIPAVVWLKYLSENQIAQEY
jgi:hypothetical protein